MRAKSGPIASAQNRGTFRKSVRRRRRKTPPNGERAPSGMRRTPSKSLVPTDRDGSQELSRLLFYCFSSRWRFDFSHRDRTPRTPRTARIVRLSLLQPWKRHRLARRAFGLRRRRRPTTSAAACVTPPPPSWAPGLPDRDGRRPGPCRAKIRRVSPVWTACRSCGSADGILRFGRRRVCSSSSLRCLAVFRCSAADSVYGGPEA